MFWLVLIPFCICMFFYVIWRFFVIFGNDSKLIPLIISIILAILAMWTFMYQWDSKILDIIWTIGSRIFVLWFLLMIMLLVESIISTRYKINPRIIVWVIVIIFWLWTYFALHTKIRNLNIETDKIENNVKILLVSDIHVDNVTQDFHVKKIIKTINEEKPDIVLIAWDLMNKANEDYPIYFKILQKNETPIFAVMWNHDVMWNEEVYKKIEEIWHIRLLNNQAATFLNGVTLWDWCNAGDFFENCTWTIQIIWIKDRSVRWNKDMDQIIQESITNISQKYNDNNFTILITHQPISLEKLKNYPIDLEVAGHTHRGQFYWMRKIVEWMNDYAYWEYKLWDRTAFVTQWIWTWWLPFRLWTQSEMMIINLIKK